MTSTPAPPVDGEDFRASEAARILRLGDAERIAAERLAGAEAAHDRHGGEWASPAMAGEGAASPVQGLARPGLAVSEAAAVGSAIAHNLGTDLPADASNAPQALAAAHSNGVPVGKKGEPLVSALDAAARLTADANAAAEALESLQRLLQRQLPGLTAEPKRATTRADTNGWPAGGSSVAPPMVQPPQVHGGSDASGLAEHDRQFPAPDPSRRMPAERRRFDIRGFLAGFALSWAFGVVLYLFMTAG